MGGVCSPGMCEAPGLDPSTAKESRDSFKFLKFGELLSKAIQTKDVRNPSCSYRLFGGCYSKGVCHFLGLTIIF